MATEFYFFPPTGAPSAMTTQTLVIAFTAAGLPCAGRPDRYGHWLVVEGMESSLNLTTEDDVVISACLQFAGQDDVSVAQQVVDLFKSIGWQAADSEGML